MSPITILGIAGSLRRDSFNRALLHTAADRLPEGVELTVADLALIPLYNFDIEHEQGFPPPVAALRTALAEADALLLAVPEYNWSLPGVLKNTIDWLSRGADAPLNGKPAGAVSAAGRSGGARAQGHLRDVLAHNDVQVVEPMLQVPRARHHFADGRLITPEHLAGLDAVLAAVVEAATAARGVTAS